MDIIYESSKSFDGIGKVFIFRDDDGVFLYGDVSEVPIPFCDFLNVLSSDTENPETSLECLNTIVRVCGKEIYEYLPNILLCGSFIHGNIYRKKHTVANETSYTYLMKDEKNRLYKDWSF